MSKWTDLWKWDELEHVCKVTEDIYIRQHREYSFNPTLLMRHIVCRIAKSGLTKFQ